MTIDQELAFTCGFLAAKAIVRKTELPEGYQWSDSNIEKFRFGIELALNELDLDKALEEYKSKGIGVAF